MPRLSEAARRVAVKLSVCDECNHSWSVHRSTRDVHPFTPALKAVPGCYEGYLFTGSMGLPAVCACAREPPLG